MRRNVGREVVRQIRLSLKWSGSKASVSLIAMAVVEVDGFESGRLSVKVGLGSGQGPNSALLRVNVPLATDDAVWVRLRDVV